MQTYLPPGIKVCVTLQGPCVCLHLSSPFFENPLLRRRRYGHGFTGGLCLDKLVLGKSLRQPLTTQVHALQTQAGSRVQQVVMVAGDATRRCGEQSWPRGRQENQLGARVLGRVRQHIQVAQLHGRRVLYGVSGAIQQIGHLTILYIKGMQQRIQEKKKWHHLDVRFCRDQPAFCHASRRRAFRHGRCPNIQKTFANDASVPCSSSENTMSLTAMLSTRMPHAA